MSHQNIFTERLRQIAADKNLEQMYFVKKMELPKTTVNAWFTGQSVPRFEPLIRLADLLDVSLDYLAGRSDNPKVRKSIKTKE